MIKNILFVLPTFEIGGTVVSTKNLILLLDKDKYNVTVLSMTGIGSMKDMYVNIQQIPTTLILSSLTYASWKDATTLVRRLFCGLIRKISKCGRIRELILTSQARKIIKSDYDTVVACQEGFCSEFVSYSKAKKKVAWIRCDYSRYILGKSKALEEKIYSKFDNIICVSDITTERFKTEFPQFSSKTVTIHNPQSEDFILEQSMVNDHDVRFEKNGYTIVSVGRYDPIKRFAEIPKIASFLRSKNIEFKWYIIGDGSEEERRKIIKNILSENVEHHVVCLGLKTNPHYYIRNSDLLVCLSSSEACPRVINEAKILHVPVVCTNFDTAKEYINNKENGIIAPLSEIQYSISQILQDVKLSNYIKDNISTFHFDNNNIMMIVEDIL